MEKKYQILFDEVEKNSQTVLDCERYIWKHPETGYREWKTHAYLKEKYEALGYEVHEAGNIPGFYVDVETGRPGPKVAVFGEMDSLVIPSHPECDPATGYVHACGHHCQSAALLGIAIALKAPGALDELCGSIRLIAVPAEEGVEFEFRRELKKEGVIHYYSGKMEFLYRGILDGVDLSMMVHTSSGTGMGCGTSSNGNVIKKAIFRGKASHAGGSPHLGRNALYAATTALSAANAIRETFREKDTIRFHPIITKGGDVVNAIPEEVITEAYIRGGDFEAIKDASQKINRAFAASAAALGCEVYFQDEHNHAPRYNDPNLRRAFHEIGRFFFEEENLNFDKGHGTGCSDMGDINCVMPGVHPYVGGCVGSSHSNSYYIADPYQACVTSAKVQAGVLALLLSNEGERAKEVIANARVPYASKEDFFRAVEEVSFCGNGVEYKEDGTVVLKFKD